MSGLLRVGAEWTPFELKSSDALPMAGFAFAGIIEGTAGIGIDIVSPGRTGGSMWRFTRNSLNDLGWMVAGDAHPGTEPSFDLIGDGMVARSYFKQNQYPSRDLSGSTWDPGIPILGLSVAGSAMNYVMLCNDGTLGIGLDGLPNEAVKQAGSPSVPNNEWYMVEYCIYSRTSRRQHIIRLTVEGEEPQIIFCKSQSSNWPTALTNDPAQDVSTQCTVAVGMMRDGGSGFVLEADDVAVNSLYGEENNTWPGPGEVRIGRPTSDGSISRCFTPGGFDCTSWGEQEGTVFDHAEVDDPYDNFHGNLPRYPALANNPIIYPPAAGPEHSTRVISAGADWHQHNIIFPAPPTGSVWYEDYPRTSFSGDSMELVCDTSEQDGIVSFAMPVSIAGHVTYGGTGDDVPGYFSIYLDSETPPTSGDEDDRATIKYGDWDPSEGEFGGTDSAVRGAPGRQVQFPTLSDSASLIFRREHDGGAAAHVMGGTDHNVYMEWSLYGAGIVYESGWEEQPPIEPCLQGFVSII